MSHGADTVTLPAAATNDGTGNVRAACAAAATVTGGVIRAATREDKAEEENERAVMMNSKRNKTNEAQDPAQQRERRPTHTRTKHEARTQREPPKKTRGYPKETRANPTTNKHSFTHRDWVVPQKSTKSQLPKILIISKIEISRYL
jgi:hypothetical protein